MQLKIVHGRKLSTISCVVDVKRALCEMSKGSSIGRTTTRQVAFSYEEHLMIKVLLRRTSYDKSFFYEEHLMIKVLLRRTSYMIKVLFFSSAINDLSFSLKVQIFMTHKIELSTLFIVVGIKSCM